VWDAWRAYRDFSLRRNRGGRHGREFRTEINSDDDEPGKVASRAVTYVLLAMLPTELVFLQAGGGEEEDLGERRARKRRVRIQDTVPLPRNQ
jgi:hypothetical protein